MAAKKSTSGAKGDLYELKHKQGSFYDFETELTINRDDQVEISEPMGKATSEAINAGRIVLVREVKEKQTEA